MGVVAYENADMGIYFIADQMDIGQKSFQRGNINGIYVNPFRVVGWSQ